MGESFRRRPEVAREPYYVESRTDGSRYWYAVACDVCDWWDDEEDSYSSAVAVGHAHVVSKHPEVLAQDTAEQWPPSSSGSAPPVETEQP